GQNEQTVARKQEVAEKDRTAKRRRDRRRQRGRPPHDTDRLFGDHGKTERDQQAQDRIGGVEPAQDEPLEQDAEQGDRDRRQHDGGAEAEIFGDFDAAVSAERVERAMRQVDDAADAEDQRQPERDQKIIASEHEAIHYLFQQESELHSRIPGRHKVSASAASGPVTAGSRGARKAVAAAGRPTLWSERAGVLLL